MRANSLYTYNGVTKTMIQWAEEYNMTADLLCNRLIKCKWDIGAALNTPSQKKWASLPIDEILAKSNAGISILKISVEYGCNWSTIKRLIKKHSTTFTNKH